MVTSAMRCFKLLRTSPGSRACKILNTSYGHANKSFNVVVGWSLCGVLGPTGSAATGGTGTGAGGAWSPVHT
eukprot:428010-Lingulodinium_polyedra.AAC.1